MDDEAKWYCVIILVDTAMMVSRELASRVRARVPTCDVCKIAGSASFRLVVHGRRESRAFTNAKVAFSCWVTRALYAIFPIAREEGFCCGVEGGETANDVNGGVMAKRGNTGKVRLPPPQPLSLALAAIAREVPELALREIGANVLVAAWARVATGVGGTSEIRNEMELDVLGTVRELSAF